MKDDEKHNKRDLRRVLRSIARCLIRIAVLGCIAAEDLEEVWTML